MKIVSNGGITPAAPVAASERIEAATPAAPTAQAVVAEAPLASEVLKPAAAALAAMPEIDEARVAELRDAIARGEIGFDAGKLAGLILRYHGGRG
ncbi:flagellar biosynthesis anti-sigma factor FlgM [Rubrivivax gelatinosus]|uniref:Negative regulator of flagellin synthesis n=1 Tax=Rubrivivax gelatinosus TaxID=28068 RepID=A0ABS1E445_RUBGE|nr:flagellar biosynthesis anti-sigma factor FlgM [Rubrivivax gelatinosus]MBK1616483.1 flagellar biosynthesis anti-sigma factor FlgM [Rubrivivax gelatinosus]MBK1715695.1 flagellar biosynthesis anti-sigma factor FlgM [Rubrivivax gelatinosus]